jgi:hypothetical protein
MSVTAQEETVWILLLTIMLRIGLAGWVGGVV